MNKILFLMMFISSYSALAEETNCQLQVNGFALQADYTFATGFRINF